MIFPGMDGVLQAEIDRVEAHGARDLFHVTVERPVSLRHAVAAECACRRCVGVDHVRVETDVGRFAIFAVAHIQRHRLVTGVACHRQRVAAVRARVGQRVHRVGCNGTVTLHTRLHLHAHRMSRT